MNFVENVPLMFIIAILVELNGGNKKHLNYTLATFFLFRVAHVELGLRQPGSKGIGRLIGHYGTQIMYLLLGGVCLRNVKSYWGF